MALASVAQAPYLSNVLARWVDSIKPASVAVLGCAGGNGFESLSPAMVQRVVGVDINPSYIDAANRRFGTRFKTVQFLAADVLSNECRFSPVEFVFAGLIVEYVDPKRFLHKIREFLNPGGKLGVILQKKSEGHADITPGPFRSLKRLEGWMTLVDPEEFKSMAAAAGYRLLSDRTETLATGKSFAEIFFAVDWS